MEFFKKIFLPQAIFLLAGLFAFFTAGRAIASSFPVDSAGLAAYARFELAGPADYLKLQEAVLDSVTSASSTFAVGQKRYSTDGGNSNYVNFNIYVSANGWLAVYLPKWESISKIANWRPGASLGDNLLKYAIDQAATDTGLRLLSEISYYDFSHPQAAQMSLVRESLDDSDPKLTNEFTVFIPGTLYEASYAVKNRCAAPSGVTLKVRYGNDYTPFHPNETYYYGYNSNFTANKNQTVILERNSTAVTSTMVSVFIYTL